MPNKNPLRRFKIRDMCSRVRNKSADLLENLSLVWEILRGITRYFQAFLCAGIFAHPSQHLLHVSFHFSVAGLCQNPFEACFEEVWVVDDGAELQNCGTLKITLEGEDNGIRHSGWLCFELAIYWVKRYVYTHFYTSTTIFLVEPHKHTPLFDTRKPLKSTAMPWSLMP